MFEIRDIIDMWETGTLSNLEGIHKITAILFKYFNEEDK